MQKTHTIKTSVQRLGPANPKKDMARTKQPRKPARDHYQGRLMRRLLIPGLVVVLMLALTLLMNWGLLEYVEHLKTTNPEALRAYFVGMAVGVGAGWALFDRRPKD